MIEYIKDFKRLGWVKDKDECTTDSITMIHDSPDFGRRTLVVVYGNKDKNDNETHYSGQSFNDETHGPMMSNPAEDEALNKLREHVGYFKNKERGKQWKK